ncbi:hypothetical protein GCM10022246_38530 [Pedobacter ginsengiterrae]|uniref:Uncharacterized protein n=1 Tax=Pedobacter ginsengiterrae TaxID=871696 RepID=A0ABP7QKU0_9SPHI
MIKTSTLKLNVTVTLCGVKGQPFRLKTNKTYFLPQSGVRKYNVGLTVTLSEGEGQIFLTKKYQKLYLELTLS